MSLSTGSRVSRHNWTVLLIPDTAIARIEALASHEEGRPVIQDRGFVVGWRPVHPINESEYDRDYEFPENAPADVFEADDYEPIDPYEVADLGAQQDEPLIPLGVPAEAGAMDGPNKGERLIVDAFDDIADIKNGHEPIYEIDGIDDQGYQEEANDNDVPAHDDAHGEQGYVTNDETEPEAPDGTDEQEAGGDLAANQGASTTCGQEEQQLVNNLKMR